LTIGSEKDGVVESNHKDIDSRVVVCNDPTVNMPVSKSPHPKNEKMSAISPKSCTISTIVRSFKSAVTNFAISWDWILPGNHVFTVSSNGMRDPFDAFPNTSKTIHQIGLKMNYSAN
jgi:hypothetical protein